MIVIYCYYVHQLPGLPIITLLLNEFGVRCLNTLLGIIINISYFQRESLYRRVYYKYNLLKYNYFYFLNQQNLESEGLKTEILKNSGLTFRKCKSDRFPGV